MIIGKLYIHRFRLPGDHGFDNNVEEMHVRTYVHLLRYVICDPCYSISIVFVLGSTVYVCVNMYLTYMQAHTHVHTYTHAHVHISC